MQSLFAILTLLVLQSLTALADVANSSPPLLALPKLEVLAPPLQVTDDSRAKDLLHLYNAALKNLDTQFARSNDGTVYVSTGDIHAEWLRDSSVQVRPFLFFAKTDSSAADLIRGVVLRQARNISIDPYANAFYENYTVHERKYELDSLANPILLAWTYWKVTTDTRIFTPEVWAAFKVALQTMTNEQDHAQRSTYTDKRLSNRPTTKTGLVWSGFRPSDDPCYFNFNIPANAMAAQALSALSEIATSVFSDATTAAKARQFEFEVRDAVAKFSKARTADGQIVLAYEVDGLGHAIAGDDANLPNLMSLPATGFLSAQDALYQATRSRNLSLKNPYFFSGRLLSGIGSPHTPKNMVWPLALIAQANTSLTTLEFDFALSNLIKSDFGDSGLHESVNVDDSSQFTRADFGWPNAMFVELALTHWNRLPELPKANASPRPD